MNMFKVQSKGTNQVTLEEPFEVLEIIKSSAGTRIMETSFCTCPNAKNADLIAKLLTSHVANEY